MNQILVTEKLYVTPELRRKKKMYKINFILSIIVIVILVSFYAHSEYARNKEQEISEDILSEMIQSEEEITEEEREIARQDEGVWKIMVKSAQSKEQQENSNTKNSKASKKKRVKYITATNGKRYPSIGTIKIPKIDVNLPILDQSSEKLVEWLKISPCKFWGADPNEIGNFSVAGHNYRNNRFFSKVPTLTIGDKIKITNVSGKTYTYAIYDKYTVKPEETDCINPRPGKENKRVVTIITCTNDSKKRVIVHAEQI